ncbi:hypothetical protein [Arthrobacter sp. PAMC25564]|nr:hypothetical protein [Arthrobacter sp. PAMC25564]
MTAASHNDLPDHATSPSPEGRLTVLVHTAWAGWYYEEPALEGAVSAA